VHVEQLLESLERRFLLADLAQDLAETVERLEVMRVKGKRAPQVAQRDFFEYQLYEINRRVTVADNPVTNLAFARRTTCSKLCADRWWHSSTIT